MSLQSIIILLTNCGDEAQLSRDCNDYLLKILKKKSSQKEICYDLDILLNNGLIKIEDINWFNCEDAIDEIITRIHYNRISFSFLEYLVNKGFNTYNFTYFIAYLCNRNDAISLCDPFSETLCKILTHILDNYKCTIRHRTIKRLNKNKPTYYIIHKRIKDETKFAIEITQE